MYFRPTHRRRRGAILPLVALAMIALVSMVALAIDIGVVALARNQCQNAADVAALAAVRQLNGDASNNNNYSAAAPEAQKIAAANSVLNTAIDPSKVQTVVGYYAYDPVAQQFSPNFSGTKPASENWDAVQVTLSASNPTFFAQIFNINSFNAGATATAVHRPRDIAIVLDFSGSMRFSSDTAYPSSGAYTGSLNPDTVIPQFGHWSSPAYTSVMSCPASYIYTDSQGYAYAANNMTVTTQNGPPMVLDYSWRDSGGALQAGTAFDRTNGAVPSPYVASTWACPAPADWSTQSNSTVQYGGSSGQGGDLWPCNNLTFTPGTYAATAQQFFIGNNSAVSLSAAANTTAKISTANGGGGAVFDPGYLTATPLVPATTLTDNQGYGPNFKGYSMGPGYYGKTFYMWPPDPRFSSAAVPASPSPSSSIPKDTLGNYICDWRKRFFVNHGTTIPVNDNSVLWDSGGNWKQGGQNGTYDINYNAVIAWLTSGPQVLPPNLRAGRILYYSSIPTIIPATGGTQDQMWWRNYINYVIGYGSSNTQQQTLYGRQSSGWNTTVKITPYSSLTGSPKPYMDYNDNPIRPRLHFWFGPLSMMCFIGTNNDSYTPTSRNWTAGTIHESQDWQLKAGINSALSDIQKNHPADWVSLIYFSTLSPYGTARVTLGRDYATMSNALFYPFSLLSSLGDTTVEERPYDSSFNNTSSAEIPNANGGTSPEMGFMVAYNQFSGAAASGGAGRHGATKMVIFETDGLPNTTASGTFVNGGAYQSYYNSVSSGSYYGNDDPTVVSNALTVVQQICALDSANPPGYSTTKNPARVHALGFGDIFQADTSYTTQALNFLLQVQQNGGTSAPSDTSIQSYKIITGNYSTRIANIKQAMQIIMQSGIQVSLIR